MSSRKRRDQWTRTENEEDPIELSPAVRRNSDAAFDAQFVKSGSASVSSRKSDRAHKPTTRALESIGQIDEPTHRKSARSRALPDDDDDDNDQLVPANKRGASAAPVAAPKSKATVRDNGDGDDEGWTAAINAKSTSKPSKSKSATNGTRATASTRKPLVPDEASDACSSDVELDPPLSSTASSRAPRMGSARAVATLPSTSARHTVVKVADSRDKRFIDLRTTTTTSSTTSPSMRAARSKVVNLVESDDDEDDFPPSTKKKRASAAADDDDDDFQEVVDKQAHQKELSETKRLAREAERAAAEAEKAAAKEMKARAAEFKKANPNLLSTRIGDDEDDDEMNEGLSDIMDKKKVPPAKKAPKKSARSAAAAATTATPPPPPKPSTEAAWTTSAPTAVASLWNLSAPDAAAPPKRGAKKAPPKQTAAQTLLASIAGSTPPRPSPGKKAAVQKFGLTPFDDDDDVAEPSPAPAKTANAVGDVASDELDEVFAKPAPTALPPFRAGHDRYVNVNKVLEYSGSRVFVNTDKVIFGHCKSERFDDFLAGGKRRSALAATAKTGYFTPEGRKQMIDMLKERYKTPENDVRFRGGANTMKVITDVLLPELAITILAFACDKVEYEAAKAYCENPVITDAEADLYLQEARGVGSRVADANNETMQTTST